MSSPQSARSRFRLKADTIATAADVDGKETVVHIPANATIAVVDDLHATAEPNRTVAVQWLGKTFHMFAADVLDRGEPI
jgi:hypothetical protein